MMPPIIILNYDPLLPWYLAPALWMLGVGCLWATRFGSTWGARLGRRYFIFSSIVRPLGILLIGFGWLELSSPQPLPEPVTNFLNFALALWPLWAVLCLLWSRRLPIVLLVTVAILGTMAPPLIFIISMTIFWLAFCFSVWAILKLGLRQSFLYRKPGDPFVTDGPYAVVRHPQLFAAMTMAACAAFTFMDDWGDLNTFGAFNAFLFGVALWFVIRSEEKDLTLELGEQWKKYAAEVPRLLPNVDVRVWHSICKKCGTESDGKQKTCPACGEAKPRLITRPAAASGCLLPMLLPAMLLFIVTGFFLDNRLFEVKTRSRQRSRIIAIQLRNLAEGEKMYNAEFGHYRDHFLPLLRGPISNPTAGYCMGSELWLPKPAEEMTPKKVDEITSFMQSNCQAFTGVSATGFSIMAVGNIDNDPALEVWMINDDTAEPVQVRNDRGQRKFVPLTDK